MLVIHIEHGEVVSVEDMNEEEPMGMELNEMVDYVVQEH